MKIKISFTCDIGLERTNNEDSVAICSDLEKLSWNQISTDGFVPLSSLGSLLVVADGMGGANAGEVASRLAVESIEESFGKAQFSNLISSDPDIHSFIKDCIAKSNQSILEYVVQDPDAIGLGTTVVMVWIVGRKAYVAWCGDSRCYCFNPDTGLRLLTKDHSYVQDLVDKGEISQQEAFNHPNSNIITRCLGDVDADSIPEIITYDIKAGDIFLLCSDGLCGYCMDSLIEKTMYRHFEDIEGCQKALLQKAYDAGGHDNISIILCATLPQDIGTYTIGLKGKVKKLLSCL